MTNLPLSDLIEDFDIYPRHDVDAQHVGALVAAIEAGAQLPPLVADTTSKIIIDGWHRYRAYKRLYGVDGSIDVDLRKYKDRAAMLVDAVALNSTHGRRLDVMDQTRCVRMLERAKIPVKKIAIILHVPEEKVIKLRVKIAMASRESSNTIPGSREVTLKRPVLWMQGQTLTDQQVIAHHSLPGTSFLLAVNQLISALECEMINPDDHKLIDRLVDLRNAITRFSQKIKK